MPRPFRPDKICYGVTRPRARASHEAKTGLFSIVSPFGAAGTNNKVSAILVWTIQPLGH